MSSPSRNEECLTQDSDATCCDIKNCCPSNISACFSLFRQVSMSIFVRLLYAVFVSGVFIFKIAVRAGGATWVYDWLILCLGLFIIVEMFYTAIRRKGKEWKWFSPSTLALLIAILPTIWELQLTDVRGVEKGDAVPGIVLAMVFLIMFGKWMAPKGKLSNHEHSLLLISTLGSGADIVDLLDIVGGEKDHGPGFDIVVLTAFSISLLQLCVTTTAVKTLSATNHKNNSGNRVKPIGTSEEEESQMQDLENSSTSIDLVRGRYHLFCFYNEIWALVLCLVSQDVPFLAIRLVAIFGVGKDRRFSTLFFAIKNVVTILLAFNRIRVIFKEDYRPWKQQCRDMRNHESVGEDSHNTGVESPNTLESPAP